MKKYLTLCRAGILEQLQWRSSAYVTIIGNMIYLTIIYFLWKSIYASANTTVVNGMTFQDTMIYLVLATAMFNFLEMFIVWEMGRSVNDGRISLALLKPMSYDAYMFFSMSGNTIVTFFLTLLPTAVIIYFISGGGFALSTNLIFFTIAVSFGIVLNFYINYIVGIICFYTQTIWGINIMKDVIIMLLSGATIPIAFFPEALKAIVYKLPFQSIYNTPLNILINENMKLDEVLTLIGVQIFWLVVVFIISKIFFNIAIKKISVNGG